MKKRKKLLSFLLAAVMTFSSLSGMSVHAASEITWGTRPADGTTKDQPFASGTGTSSYFRIPCLVSLNDGTIVAGCDARWNTTGDGGGLDTIVSRSTDNGATWNYTFANYLGDNGNTWNGASTAFIDPAMATDGETVYMVADLYPAGVALNSATWAPKTGHTGYDENGNLALAKATESVNGGVSSDTRITASFDYHLEKIADAKEEDASYYELKDLSGETVEGYQIDAYFNIKGEDTDTNLFCADSPYFPYPTDFLYMTKSEDGGATWSVPTLIDVKEKDEQTLLVGPGRGLVTSTGRLVFTAYEFTSGDKYSCVFYSDDKGETWHRGADVSGWSSEATVVEADGKLYMFTRHGNAYYVSDDMGETWGAQQKVGVDYWNNCQLSAITYSEKIDGKTAILFSAPSSTSGRYNGKIFVGLVQEDGSLQWPYEYKVTQNGADYAYSCLTELPDGSVSLLYENAGGQIKYINVDIKEIAKNATIGNLWLAKDGQPVSAYAMKPNQTVEFTVEGLEEGEILTAISGDETFAKVTVSDNKVVVQTETVKEFEEVTISVVAGTQSASLNLCIAEAENYKIVRLEESDQTVFTDETGNYADSVDLSEVDESVAQITVIGKDKEEVTDETNVTAATLLLGTDTAFSGSETASKNALFTVSSQLSLAGTDADGNTVYVQPYASSNGYPNVTSQVAITLSAGSEENSFYIYGNGGYLHFHDGRYDRVKTLSGFEAGCTFKLYEPADGTGSTEIPGYQLVSEVKDGGQYLIVAGTNGTYYVMYPSTGKDNLYAQVAKVTGESDEQGATVQLGSSAAFDGEKISAGKCLYTLSVSGCTVVGNADGTAVGLNLATAGYPTTTSASNIRITESAYVEGSFELYDTVQSRYLHFHDDTFKFNRCSSNDANHSFEVYKKAEKASMTDTITGYTKVTGLEEILAGGQFLFARKAADENYYVLYPSKDNSSVYNYVAKVKNFEPKGASTEIIIKAVGVGKTSVEVNGLTYYVEVSALNEEENPKYDISLEGVKATAASEDGGTYSGVGGAAYAIDGDESTAWMTAYAGYGTTIKNGEGWIDLEFPEPHTVDGYRYLPAAEKAGYLTTITGYEIYVKTTTSEDYIKVATGSWDNTLGWKIAKFDAVPNVTNVKLLATQALPYNWWAIAAEVRVVSRSEYEGIMVVDKALLEEAITAAEELTEENYTAESWAVFAEALEDAKAVLADEEADQETVDAALAALTAAKEALAEKEEEKEPADAADDSKDVPVEMYITSAGSTQPGGSTGSAIDGDTSTFWEVAWDIGATNPEVLWYQIELEEAVELEALRYYPRSGSNQGSSNGFITDYQVLVSNDGEEWTVVSEGSWEMTTEWKIAEFDSPVTAKYVRLFATGTYADVGNNTNMSIAEIRVKSVEKVDYVPAVKKDTLEAAINKAEALKAADYVDFTAVEEALAAAKAVYANEEAAQEEVDAAAAILNAAVKALVKAATAEERAALKEAIDKAKALNAADYVDFTAVEAALTAAEEVYANEKASQSEVKAATNKLNKAIKALVEVVVEENEVVRLYGADRYATGIAAADELKSVLGVEKFDTVVIATGKGYADALSGSYLAAVKNAPILLTNGKAANIAELHAYIKANVKAGGKVYILGGKSAVPEAVEAIEGYDVTRLAGGNRYETNLAILAEAGYEGQEDLLVATGKSFADSLSASAAARPILLVKPNAALTDGQKAVAANFANIYVIGGEGAVSAATAEELAAYGSVTRLSGSDRYETSVAVAEAFFTDPETVVLAYGKNYPDGLCGGALAAALNAPLILTKEGSEDAAAAYVAANGIASGYVLGGDGVLPNDTVVTVFGLDSAADIIKR